jgi:PilZ domain
MSGSLPPLPQHPRRPGRVDKQQFVEVTVYRANAEARSQSRMVDFSPTGVGLLHPDYLNVGEQFSISILQPRGHRIKFLYNVVYCNKDKRTGDFHVGGEFICAVTVAA